MKHILKLFFYLYFLLSHNGIIAQTTTTTLNYVNSNLGTGCNIFDPGKVFNGLNHVSYASGVEYDPSLGLRLNCTAYSTSPAGTAFYISYNFKPDFWYNISTTTSTNSSSGDLYFLVQKDLSNDPSTNYHSCYDTTDKKVSLYPEYPPNLIIKPVDLNLHTYSTGQFSVPGSDVLPYLLIFGVSGTTVANEFDINNIVISETPIPRFSLSPQTVNVVCGSTVTTTFTVTNIKNSPGVTSYEWDLGSTNNGWLINGSPAPQHISTTTPSLTLTSSLCNNVLSDVNVVVNMNNAAYQTLTATSSISIPTFSISGNPIICNSENYTVNGNVGCGNVTWSLPSGSGSVLSFSPNPPVGTSISITNQKYYQIATTLTATITNLGCTANPITINKSIQNDNDNSANTSYSFNQDACVFNNVYHSSQSGYITSNAAPIYVHQGCTVYVNVGSLGNKTINFIPTGSDPVSNPIFWNYNGSQLIFQLPYGSGGIPFTFKITGAGACFEKNLLFFTYTNNGNPLNKNNFIFNISPNPVNNYLEIKAVKNELPHDSKDEELFYSIKIYDVNFNKLWFSQRNIHSAIHRINTSNLNPGVYILQILENGELTSIKFIKEYN